MSFSFRPAVRADTPLIIGLAGPTKSGKTMSAHRLAAGLADGGVVAMINAEGARGHQYADKFKYVACDIDAPFSPARYQEAIEAAKELNPAVLIIDSASHMHDGPGGMLEFHDDELDRMAGDDYKKRQSMTWTAWIRPKRDENQVIYSMLGLHCPVILCFRAKEKLKIISGKPPIDLGWQPIASDRMSFETIFTLVLPPHCKGVPDLSISEMREPFDSMIPEGRPLDEAVGRKLAEWAAGGKRHTAASEQTIRTTHDAQGNVTSVHVTTQYINAMQAADLESACSEIGASVQSLKKAAGVSSLTEIRTADYPRALAWINTARAKREAAS